MENLYQGLRGKHIKREEKNEMIVHFKNQILNAVGNLDIDLLSEIEETLADLLDDLNNTIKKEWKRERTHLYQEKDLLFDLWMRFPRFIRFAENVAYCIFAIVILKKIKGDVK